MKIAILYIGIGRYIRFFDDFYKSCETFFMPGVEKAYFFFTDRMDIEVGANVRRFYQEDLGWPGNTLYRFDMFLRHRRELEQFDYLFFFNGNTLFLHPVEAGEVIPDDAENGLTMLSWVNIYTDNRKFPYERNAASTAYIPYGEGIHYYQGGLNGGRAAEYLAMLETCRANIATDLESGFVACSHDESHINRYLLSLPVKVLGPEYGRPEEWSEPADPKIIFREKKKWLGHGYLRRLKKRTLLTKIGNRLRRALGLSVSQ